MRKLMMGIVSGGGSPDTGKADTNSNPHSVVNRSGIGKQASKKETAEWLHAQALKAKRKATIKAGRRKAKTNARYGNVGKRGVF